MAEFFAVLHISSKKIGIIYGSKGRFPFATAVFFHMLND